MTPPWIASLDEIRRRLRPYLARAERAILFGSAARGVVDAWSDLDLVIVARTERPFFERFKDFAGLYDVWPQLDLLIYTPEDFEQMVAERRPIIEQALAEGVLLREAQPSGS